MLNNMTQYQDPFIQIVHLQDYLSSVSIRLFCLSLGDAERWLKTKAYQFSGNVITRRVLIATAKLWC